MGSLHGRKLLNLLLIDGSCLCVVFVLVDVLGWVQQPPHAGLGVLFILPFLGALDRAMKTLAVGMCGKSQICFKGKNWQIIFFDGYMERKALRETDS